MYKNIASQSQIELIGLQILVMLKQNDDSQIEYKHLLTLLGLPDDELKAFLDSLRDHDLYLLVNKKFTKDDDGYNLVDNFFTLAICQRKGKIIDYLLYKRILLLGKEEQPLVDLDETLDRGCDSIFDGYEYDGESIYNYFERSETQGNILANSLCRLENPHPTILDWLIDFGLPFNPKFSEEIKVRIMDTKTLGGNTFLNELDVDPNGLIRKDRVDPFAIKMEALQWRFKKAEIHFEDRYGAPISCCLTVKLARGAVCFMSHNQDEAPRFLKGLYDSFFNENPFASLSKEAQNQWLAICVKLGETNVPESASGIEYVNNLCQLEIISIDDVYTFLQYNKDKFETMVKDDAGLRKYKSSDPDLEKVRTMIKELRDICDTQSIDALDIPNLRETFNKTIMLLLDEIDKCSVSKGNEKKALLKRILISLKEEYVSIFLTEFSKYVDLLESSTC